MTGSRAIGSALPLDQLPVADRARIERLAAAPSPPPRWISLCGGLATIESRAWYEWYWRRGIRPDVREKIPATLRREVLARDGLVCGICGAAVERRDVHIDHVEPVVRAGPTTLANLRVTHAACNLRKGGR